MSKWSEGIEGIHKEIAADNSKLLHVLAGPGTGKTFAMMRRIARVLEEGTFPHRILAVTFTRTAQRDLCEQLAKLDAPNAHKVNATTLHSFCFKILNRQEAFSFTQRTPRPLLSFEIDCLESDLSGSFGGKKKVRKLKEAYEAAWARMQRDQPGYAQTEEDQNFETLLLAWLRFHESMLIGELVPLTSQFMKSNPLVSIAPDFEHVLVDEYQDLNKADQMLIQLFSKSSSFIVIGDDNQSIYRFRYANPEGIRSFPSDFPSTVKYSIQECRRCPPNIVEISNSLISHDPQTTRMSPLVADKAKELAEITIVQHATLQEETESLSDFVQSYLLAHPDVSHGQVLVLSPSRFIGSAIKNSLIERGFNALSYFQEDALEEENAAKGFCLLTLLANDSDRSAIRASLGFDSSDHRSPAYGRIRQYCEENEVSLIDVLNKLAEGSITISHSANIVSQWVRLKERLTELKSLKGLELVNELWPTTIQEADDIRNLASKIATTKPEPKDLLDELRTAITQSELPGSDSDIIQVMSLHKSKGLTRDVVIIAGCMAGTLPRIDSKDAREVQEAQFHEQRRLFYVAITRAKKALVISASVALPLPLAKKMNTKVTRQQRQSGETMAYTTFSPFIQELGKAAPSPISGTEWKKSFPAEPNSE